MPSPPQRHSPQCGGDYDDVVASFLSFLSLSPCLYPSAFPPHGETKNGGDDGDGDGDDGGDNDVYVRDHCQQSLFSLSLSVDACDAYSKEKGQHGCFEGESVAKERKGTLGTRPYKHE